MFSRHDLAWLTPYGWERACAAAPAGSRAAIADWASHGWPAVVTRMPAALTPGQVALGIALPPGPDGSKPRIALAADAAGVARLGPPLLLAEAIAAAPSRWQAALLTLDAEARAGGLALHVYGSLAFQALTGLSYLTASSDIDLLLHPARLEQCRDALALLARHAVALPLDGEIVFGGAQAVAWKELARARDGAAHVLAKSLHSVALVPVGSLFATLVEDAACTH